MGEEGGPPLPSCPHRCQGGQKRRAGRGAWGGRGGEGIQYRRKTDPEMRARWGLVPPEWLGWCVARPQKVPPGCVRLLPGPVATQKAIHKVATSSRSAQPVGFRQAFVADVGSWFRRTRGARFMPTTCHTFPREWGISWLWCSMGPGVPKLTFLEVHHLRRTDGARVGPSGNPCTGAHLRVRGRAGGRLLEAAKNSPPGKGGRKAAPPPRRKGEDGLA